MKRSLIYILFIILFLPIFSCNSMLDEENYGNLTEDEMLRDEANIVLLVGQAYAEVKWLHDHWGYWGINTLTADECVCPVRKPGDHWSDGGYWAGMNTHSWNPESKAFENVWNQSISGAVLCNKIIQTLKNNQSSISPTLYARYVGELEVLRSYYFYTLFDSFGRIPYTEEFKENTAVPLMGAAEVWTKLVECLERNAPNLPAVTAGNRVANYGRVTQGFAYALLARLYLNAESYGVPASSENFYSKCIDACQEVIDAGSYIIEDDFFTNFKINNEGSKENIFVIVEDGNAEFDARSIGSMSNKLRVTMLSLHYCHQTAWNLIEKPWNGFCAPPDFLARYADSDLRGPGVEGQGTKNARTYGWFVGPVYDTKGENILKDENKDDAVIVPTITSLTGAGWAEGARFLKYEIDKEAKYKFCENDFVLFRYADVLYMQAEAFLRGGTSSTGASLGNLIESVDFQSIRTRVGLTPYSVGDLTLDEILDERGREFAWENIRRRDLIRYRKFAEGTWFGKNPKPATYNWFPIPSPVILKSEVGEDGEHIWTQNPGY
ncbi:MAG: RagB/SusD family nutrient uptake outer membrane protein [Prevotellaceae bacterium]|jgi:hypothetical protein|nr:RagB/SusD family nutrient uptake outer membrane protein [Prevotellaceae bacterium]